MITGILFNVMFLLLARDYKYVDSGGADWALVLVLVLFFVGAEIAAHFDSKNKK